MATIKVKLRPSLVEEKLCVIYYQIIHNRKSRQIATQYRVSPSEWNEKEEKLVLSCSRNCIIQCCIDSDVALLHRIIYNMERRGKNYSVKDIVDDYRQPKNHICMLDYMQKQVEQLRATNRFGTAKNYEKVMCSFSEFLGSVSFPMSAVNEQVIAAYNVFLVRRGLVRNSISFYMRVLRSNYNKAVRQKLIEQQYPFAAVYTGVDNTRKRAVDESLILRLYHLELLENSPIALCRDIFIFSYCTRGMAFVDITFLRKSDLHNGSICYVRRKTGQLLSVKIEPCIQRIIDRYDNAKSPYIFPILTSDDAVEAYEQYVAALNTYNRLLGRLSKKLGCGCKLTSYTSRHSWATIARVHNVPISVISQGMGHTSEQTTQIYLKTLENSIIDAANKEIIEFFD